MGNVLNDWQDPPFTTIVTLASAFSYKVERQLVITTKPKNLKKPEQRELKGKRAPFEGPLAPPLKEGNDGCWVQGYPD
ncbi:MAG TPA: hypothetical protein VLO12_10940 [Halomonas sp.]|nr:hypothetical protein [Halomonas sp.]